MQRKVHRVHRRHLFFLYSVIFGEKYCQPATKKEKRNTEIADV